MSEPDDLLRDPALKQPLPSEPGGGVSEAPQGAAVPEEALPLPASPAPAGLEEPPPPDTDADLLDVDYVFPPQQESDQAEVAASASIPAEVSAAAEAGGYPLDSTGPAETDSAGLSDNAEPAGTRLPEGPTEADPSSALQPSSEVAPAPPEPHSYVTGSLEEQTYVATVAATGPQAGEVVSGYQLNQDLGRGWFSANALGAGPSVDVYVRPAPLWAELRPHRLLPRLTPAGDLLVLPPNEGTPLTLPLDPAAARAHLTELARLLFALEKQGYAVTDLDPASVQLTRDGLNLRRPPQVTRLGEVAQPTLRDSFTPPEVQDGQPAQAKSGVYLLGALFFQWLTGRPLPAEGPSPIVLAGIKASGAPQLLSGMLAPLPQRLSPTELLGTLQLAAVSLPVYQVAAATDIGLNPERPVNEDAYGFVWRQTGLHGGGEVSLRAVVSDGMGGMAAGEVASQAAVRAFLDSGAATVEAQVWESNAAVLAAMQGRDGGCTLTAVEIRGARLQLGHVGDSRAYLAQGGAVQQLSKDHSYVAAMVASGQMTPEEAQVSPERNKVLRSLGSLRSAQENYVQVLMVELPVGSRVLLLSDGVWGEAAPPVLHDLLLHEPSPQRVVDRLIEVSLDSGAPDNATALLIERVR